MGKITINIPITVNYYREEDKVPAGAFTTLVERELLSPEKNERLIELVEEAKKAALAEIEKTY